MKTISIKGWVGIIFAAVLLSSGCKSDPKDDPDGPDTVSRETQGRNKFALNLMQDLYLWNSHAKAMINTLELDARYEEDPVKLYGKMVYDNDKWSFMTNDMASLLEQVNNESTSYGYYLGIYRFNNSDALYAVVWYVYPGTPAAQAGLTRGDIILKINGGDITIDNYTNLVLSSNVQIELGEVSGNTISPSGEKKQMTSVQMYHDPVVFHSIIETGGKKVGYLMYTGFVLASHDRLLEVFQEFKNNGVDDVILDLRYNGGGYTETAELICNVLAPQSVIDAKKVMVKDEYNNNIGKSIKQFSNLYKKDGKMIPLPVNLNLDKRIFILVSEDTASASEMVIAGLKPYTDVILIGEKTVGKCYGGPMIDQEYYEYLYDTKAPELNNWGAYLMMFRTTNSDNEDYSNGFNPDHEVADLYLVAPYGNESDPLIAKAIEVITGIKPTKNAGVSDLLENQLQPFSGSLPRTTGFDGMIDLRKPELSGENR